MKPGMSLLELVVGLLISTMIMGVLGNLFTSSTRSVRRVEITSDIDQNSVVLLHQLSHDLSGAMMPALRVAVQPDGKPTSTDASAQKGKPIAQAFASTEKNKRFDGLTFVTTNPRTRLVPPIPQAVVKQQLVRVTYQLQENKEKHGTESVYSLFRSETTDLVPEPVTAQSQSKAKPQQLLIANNIKQFALSFKYTLTADKQPPEVKTQTAWLSDTAFEPNSQQPPLPVAVQIKAQLWDSSFANERTYDYLMLIPCYEQAIEVKKPQSPQQQQQAPAPQQPQKPQGPPRMKVGFRPRPTFLDKYFGRPA
jgi:hypothetical protein